MTTTNAISVEHTDELGPIYSLWANQSKVKLEIGNTATMQSVEKFTGRSWAILGSAGMVTFKAATESTHDLCLEWLAANGFVPDGTEYPECLEFTKKAN